ncbi:MAG: hypothetical protein FJX71_01500 [Alphaproteobacteria bacterium]|nr:hypothetical protein [Alphaproteobacteria bacterium]
MIDGDHSTSKKVWKHRLLIFIFLVSVVCLNILPVWQSLGVQPVLLLIVLYHCALYRPDLLSVEQLVLISLILDGIYAYPLGFSAVRLLTEYTLLLTQRKILGHQNFLWVWGGFCLFALIDGLLYSILISCVKSQWTGIFPIIPSILLTIGLYPLLTWALNRIIMRRLFT